jgi:isoleucyl-tRNA synthetase
MDIARAVCGAILAVRDKNNLRVRLPLGKATIISPEVEKIKEFSSIIMEETNIKNIEFLTNIEDFGEKKLTLNFSKIGDKVGVKMPAVIVASKNGQWKINEKNRLEIENFEFEEEEYSLSWTPKAENVFCAGNYNFLILLDLEITKELEQEGVARDMARLIQQYRKEAGLDVSDHIWLFLEIFENSLVEAILAHGDYIKCQTLALKFGVGSEKPADKYEFSFNGELDGFPIKINFNRIK